ncbi:TlpA family protein disulfide reductase [Roseimaritima ulvae]|uniref:Thiol-disulfide oxidoreductase ResA n=1 Tax=Roseimaritima ulvae TaxID=980254 RepID=A0A5B9R0I2_9BACT|nr:TlpA family protein disulfide reductase [Roseimaritima ulvae]QEG43730.1 Thiol-disulfide oxidoreductase ResA [Roseimaritima ulvae]
MPDSPLSPDAAPVPAAETPPTNKGISLFWWISGLIIAVLFIALLVVPRRPDAGPAVGKPAPRISVTSLGESTPPLDEPVVQPERVVLLHFWGTWCGPCRQEYPELVAMAQELEAAHSGFQFVSVSCEPPVGDNTLETLRESTYGFYAKIGVDVPTYCDPRGYSRAAAAEVLERPAMYYPTTILIGGDGKVAAVWEGYSRHGVEQMRETAEGMLGAAR